MSMNLHVSGTREVSYKNKAGETKTSEQVVRFDLWQTPTKITREILQSDNHKQAYIDWVRSISEDEVEEIYDYEPMTLNHIVIGTETVNHGEDHIKELEEWLEFQENDGYEIEFFEL